MMKFIGIIPARYASTRFPGKPLADMNGKPMIQRVYEQVKDVLDSVCVATDDIRIENAVKAFGGQVVMTSDQHRSGTDRCYEAYQKIGEGYDVIVNIQGDEPFIHPEQIQTIKTCFADANTQIATLVKPFRSDDDFESTLFNPNSPKVVLNKNNEAMYFSRSIIPYIRGKKYTEWLPSHTFYKHIGLYAYRAQVLKEITLDKVINLYEGQVVHDKKQLIEWDDHRRTPLYELKERTLAQDKIILGALKCARANGYSDEE